MSTAQPQEGLSTFKKSFKSVFRSFLLTPNPVFSQTCVNLTSQAPPWNSYWKTLCLLLWEIGSWFFFPKAWLISLTFVIIVEDTAFDRLMTSPRRACISHITFFNSAHLILNWKGNNHEEYEQLAKLSSLYLCSSCHMLISLFDLYLILASSAQDSWQCCTPPPPSLNTLKCFLKGNISAPSHMRTPTMDLRRTWIKWYRYNI